MPIKIDAFRNVRQYRKVPLYKKNKSVKEIKDSSGINIFKDNEFHPFHLLVLKLLDKANGIIKRYPKVGNKILSLSEKLLKNADYLK